eukprot:364491-Chlamydomonas_euryale.AAC.17
MVGKGVAWVGRGVIRFPCALKGGAPPLHRVSHCCTCSSAPKAAAARQCARGGAPAFRGARSHQLARHKPAGVAHQLHVAGLAVDEHARYGVPRARRDWTAATRQCALPAALLGHVVVLRQAARRLSNSRARRRAAPRGLRIKQLAECMRQQGERVQPRQLMSRRGGVQHVWWRQQAGRRHCRHGCAQGGRT